MQTINVVLIRTSGLTVTFQADDWHDAYRRAVIAFDDSMARNRECGDQHIERCFMSSGERLEEHSFKDMRAFNNHARVKGGAR